MKPAQRASHLRSGVRDGVYRPNLTVTCDPDATWDPGGGDCWRARPLPTASKSSPLSCAISIAVRTLLPRNDGTTIPPCSTSNTIVPLDGRCAGSGVGPGGLSSSVAVCLCSGTGDVAASDCRKAAGTTALTATSDVGLAELTTGWEFESCGIESTASRLSPRRSGDPSSTSRSFTRRSAMRTWRLVGSSTSWGVCRYSRTCCATRWKTGAEICPPWCSPTAESRMTATVMAGSLTGANPANDPTYLVCEYACVAGSTFWAVPVFPAEL